MLAAAACGERSTPAAGAAGDAPAAASGAPPAPEAFRPVGVGDAAPAYAARTLAGAEARVGERGAPVTLLNVWATWCTSCREEMGDLAALHREFGARGLRVLAVSVDEGPEAKVRRFAERERLPFAVAHDPGGRVQSLYGVVGVPETYLVGGDGRVLWKRAGNVHGVLGEARAAVGAALGAPAAR